MDMQKAEEAYNQALEIIDVLDVIVRPQDMARECKKIARLFRQAGNYKDAPQQAAIYKARVREERLKGKELDYQRAVKRMNDAVNERDYKRVEASFRKLKDYKDAAQKAEECSRLRIKMIKKANLMLLVKAVSVVAVVVIFILAKGWYSDYQAEVKEQKKAEKEAQKREMQADLEHLEVGKTAFFGNHEWTVVEKDEDVITLMVIHCGTFEGWHDVSFHDAYEEVDWEHSAVREWLNGEFLETSFTEEEKERILLTEVPASDNPVYETTGGADTRDYVYLPSYEDVLKYQESVSTMKLTWLLRTPGNDSKSVMYMKESEPEMYGYAVDAKQFSLRPLIRVKLNK